MTNAGTLLIHLICSGWVKNCSTSTLAFDIAQFFPSLNYQILSLIMDKAEFNLRIFRFFSNYLVGRKTKYLWNNFSSLFFDVNVGMGQGLALSPILFALYLLLVFHIFEKRLKNLKIPVSFISFVNDNLLISQNKSFKILNANLFCSYHVIYCLLDHFELVIEQGKTSVFYFSRAQGAFNPPSLDLSILGGPILHPKEMWQYLGFIFNRKLFFHQHINFYMNKAISTVKSMKMLGNSSRGLISTQKHLLYKTCILPIALYSFPLWYYNNALLLYLFKVFKHMQRRATLGIIGVF